MSKCESCSHQGNPTYQPSSREPTNGCVFCDIVSGRTRATATVLFENDRLMIIRDVRPATDHHYLAIPKEHIRNATSLFSADRPLILEMEKELRALFEQMHIDNDDALFGFHWPPFVSVTHLHMHGIAPASKMGFLSRWIFKPFNQWFCTPQYVSSQLKCGGGCK